MNARQGDPADPRNEAQGTTRRISGDKPSYPVPQRPANPHAPPKSRQDPSER